MKFLTQYFELIAFLTGLFYYKKLKSSTYYILVWLLFFVIVAESIGMYQRRILHIPNVQVYNIITGIEFLVYALIFKKIIRWNVTKKVINVFFIVYPICWLLNMIFIQGFNMFHTYTMSIGSIFMVFLAFSYLYNLFNIEYKFNLLGSPDFWFSIGILFFYAGDMLNSFLIFYVDNVKIIADYSLFRIINTSFNIILYSCFIKAFRCSPKKNI